MIARPRSLFTQQALAALIAHDDLCLACNGSGRIEIVTPKHARGRHVCPACGGDGVPPTAYEARVALDARRMRGMGRGEWKATREVRL